MTRANHTLTVALRRLLNRSEDGRQPQKRDMGAGLTCWAQHHADGTHELALRWETWPAAEDAEAEAHRYARLLGWTDYALAEDEKQGRRYLYVRRAGGLL